MRRRTLVTAALVLLLQGSSVEETVLAEGPDTPVSRRLAEHPALLLHETYRDGNWEIFVRHPDGSDARNLTGTPEIHEMYPQASPDGSRIAFVTDGEADGRTVRSVWWMHRDGSGRKLVAHDAREPAFGPDSKTIAYLGSEFRRFSVKDFATKGLFFHDVETGETRPHPNKDLHHLYNLTWSADGEFIVSTVHAGMGFGHAILAIAVDGDGENNGVTDLGIPGCRPTLSPDGKKLCWGRDDHTIAIGDFVVADGKPHVENARDIASEPVLHLYHSDWSPDGRFISFSRGPGGTVSAEGPGTNRGLAEFIGVRAKWDVEVVSVEDGARLVITTDGESNKESDWLPPAPRAHAEEEVR